MDPIISDEELADYLSRPSAENDPTAIAACDAASQVCRTTTDQLLNEVTDDTLVLDGTGTDVLVLKQLPVTEVSTVLDNNGDAVDPTAWTLTAKGTLVRYASVWVQGRQNFTVTYSHGFADADMPSDLRMVALSLAGRIYMQGPVVFEAIGKRQVRYAGPAMDLSNTEQAILRKYKQTL